MLSVALCTYNGASYIDEQIRSILKQTLPVDEIVVCDDGSTDNTLQIIEELSKEATVVFRVFKNRQCLGPSRNFDKAIGLCQGDIVFLSDQDDVWCENKVQVIVDWFDDNPGKSVVFSDAELIDEDGSLVTDKSLWDCIGFTSKAQVAFDGGFGIEIFCNENRATGATMAVRNTFVKTIGFVGICDEIVLHDGALAILALEQDALGYLPCKLTKYRCHGSQSVGIGSTIKNPLSDDCREIGRMSHVWIARPLPEKLLQRMRFAALRYNMIHQRVGLFRIFGKTCLYRVYYGKQWKSFMKKDISMWKNN